MHEIGIGRSHGDRWDVQRHGIFCLILILNYGSIVKAFAPTTHFCAWPKSSSTSQLDATLSFSGDASAELDFVASVSSVQEWLQSSASDLHLLGATEATQRPDGLWDCRQPRINFLSLDLVPIFVNKLERKGGNTITVSIVQARTDILTNKNRANRVVASVMERSKFVGKSAIWATGTDKACQLGVDLSLTLRVPLSRFVLLPPGFNIVGSSIVGRTGKSRTKQLLQDLKNAYRVWAEAEGLQEDDV